MRYVIMFLILACGVVVLAIQHGGAAWMLVWPAASFVLLAAGYGRMGGKVIGKRADGRIAAWGWLVNGPYLLTTLGFWHLERLLLKQARNPIAPNLWLGRRPLGWELDGAIRWVVDLTAEMPAAAGVRDGRGYLLFPTLDGHVMAAEDFARAVEQVAALEEVVLIHCAVGHGRSAMLAAAVLVRRGLAADIDDAIRMLRKARPRVWINPRQRRALDAWLREHRQRIEACQSSSISKA